MKNVGKKNKDYFKKSIPTDTAIYFIVITVYINWIIKQNNIFFFPKQKTSMRINEIINYLPKYIAFQLKILPNINKIKNTLQYSIE